MLTNYIRAALHQARYEMLPEDNSFYGEIPGFEGVYSNAATLEACREELSEVLEEWILFRISRNLPLPVAGGIELVIREVA
jgi:predicted RNase H-like HicB family nuclease